MGSDVFISFEFNDTVVAQKVHDYLKDKGINCFWYKDIPGGSEYGKVLGNAILGSKIFLLLLSASSDASHSVYQEAMIAHNAKIIIVPIRLENITPENLLYPTAGYLYFDTFDRPLEQALKSLVIDVKKQLAALVPMGLGTSPAPKGNSKTYANDAAGFTVQYPPKWISKPLDGDPQVLKVSAGADATSDTVYVYVIPAATNLNAATKSLLDNSPVFQQYKVTATINSSKSFLLTNSSVSTGVATEFAAKIVIYNFYYYAIGATKGDKSVIVIGGTIGGGSAKAQIIEICESLSFK
jgi:hypothetical protein